MNCSQQSVHQKVFRPVTMTTPAEDVHSISAALMAVRASSDYDSLYMDALSHQTHSGSE